MGILSKELKEEVVDDIISINLIDPASVQDRLSKLMEETGELVQSVNKMTGRKTHNLSDEEIEKEIIEELADVLQCTYSYTAEYIFKNFGGENAQNENKSDSIKNKLINIIDDAPMRLLGNKNYLPMSSISLFRMVGKLDIEVDVYRDSAIMDNIENLKQMIGHIFNMVNDFEELDLNSLHKTVFQKNRKWRKVAEEKKKK